MASVSRPTTPPNSGIHGEPPASPKKRIEGAFSNRNFQTSRTYAAGSGITAFAVGVIGTLSSVISPVVTVGAFAYSAISALAYNRLGSLQQEGMQEITKLKQEINTLKASSSLLQKQFNDLKNQKSTIQTALGALSNLITRQASSSDEAPTISPLEELQNKEASISASLAVLEATIEVVNSSEQDVKRTIQMINEERDLVSSSDESSEWELIDTDSSRPASPQEQRLLQTLHMDMTRYSDHIATAREQAQNLTKEVFEMKDAIVGILAAMQDVN